MPEEGFGSLRPTPFPTGTKIETQPGRVSFEFRYLSQCCPSVVPQYAAAGRCVRMVVNRDIGKIVCKDLPSFPRQHPINHSLKSFPFDFAIGGNACRDMT